jgi:quinol monooxygenase YgiN
MENGVIVISSYKAKPGHEKEFVEALRDHVPTLRRQGLLTDFPSSMMTGEDGAIVEIFEWKSEAASDKAHKDPVVQALWHKMERLAVAIPLADLRESKKSFAHFHKKEMH